MRPGHLYRHFIITGNAGGGLAQPFWPDGTDTFPNAVQAANEAAAAAIRPLETPSGSLIELHEVRPLYPVVAGALAYRLWLYHGDGATGYFIEGADAATAGRGPGMALILTDGLSAAAEQTGAGAAGVWLVSYRVITPAQLS